jgi:hypothetical protein
MRRFLAINAALAAALFSSSAGANSGGVAGYTGKPNAAAPQGESCNQCHGGGTAPTVALAGPTSLAAGQSAEYSLVVTTGQIRAAGAIAATDGVVLAPVSNLRDSFGEMVQNAPVTPANGQATFRFRVTAPMTGTTVRLWAVGLAANGAGTAGDRATHTTQDITITGGAAPAPAPDAGAGQGGGDPPPSTPDAGGGAPDDEEPSSGTGGGATGPDDTYDEGDDGDLGMDDDGTIPRPARSRRADMEAPGSCAQSPLTGSSGAALSAVAALALAATLRRRRRTA